MKIESGKLKVFLGLFSLLFYFSTFSFGQVRLENQYLRNKNLKEAYKGLDNPLEIVGGDSTLDYDIKCSSKNKIIKEGKVKNAFRYRISSYAKDTLKVYFKGKLIATEYFQGKRIPSPSPFVYKNGRSRLNIAQINAMPYLYCWPFEYNLKMHVRVISFELTIKDENGKVVIPAVRNSGYKISEQNMIFINQKRKGATLYFENIRATAPDWLTRRLNNLTIKII